jgi:hypothetical protein
MAHIKTILPDKKFCSNSSRKLQVGRLAGMETAER